ncbi:LexA-binding, inner membrane-associated putative hydrolase [Candidatus Gugararchaeum adminiculabundum]|nr:LexA-binding, inner membrane-associated putative hydrolase [Candidatus Gugararchaeum adminiculabundum]
MNYPGHLLTAFLASILLLAAMNLIFYIPFSLIDSVALILVCLGSTMLPDLDHPESKGTQLTQRFLPPLIMLFAFGTKFAGYRFSENTIIPKLQDALIFGFAGIGFFFVITNYFRPSHRGITHSLLVNTGYGALIWVVTGYDVNVTIFAAGGYLTHLLTDQCIKLV